VSVLSRNTQGVRLIKLKAEERLVGLERVQEPADQGGHADDDVDEAVEAPDA
jgi:DNA gyrase subunit A